MFETNLTEKEIYQFIEKQKENIPISSMFWNVTIYPHEKKTNYFEFFSRPHYTNTIRPVNFYKPTISIINLNEC